MPVIATFYNIFIFMRLRQKEHQPPHIHAIYNEYQAVFDIRTMEITHGNLPRNAIRLVKEFLRQNQQKLLEMWDSQKFEKLSLKE